MEARSKISIDPFSFLTLISLLTSQPPHFPPQPAKIKDTRLSTPIPSLPLTPQPAKIKEKKAILSLQSNPYAIPFNPLYSFPPNLPIPSPIKILRIHKSFRSYFRIFRVVYGFFNAKNIFQDPQNLTIDKPPKHKGFTNAEDTDICLD